MRLFLFADAAWPATDPLAAEILMAAAPSPLVLAASSTDAAEALAQAVGAPVERLAPGQRPTQQARIALVLAAGMGAQLSRAALATAVSFPRAKGTAAVVRSGLATLAERIPRTAIADTVTTDLEAVRSTLGALWLGATEHRAALARAGAVVAEALGAPSWATLAAAWAEVESLRLGVPALAPWLITPDRILGAWAAALESA